MKIYFEIINNELVEIENIPIDKLDQYPIDVIRNIDTYIDYINRHFFYFNKKIWLYDKHYNFIVLDSRDIIFKIKNIIVYYIPHKVWITKDFPNLSNIKDISMIIDGINKSFIHRRRDLKLTNIGL